jgi:1,4-alpha-glucan branching enzyme
MVSRDSAAGYARQRARVHADRFTALADVIESGAGAAELAARLRVLDGPFGRLDARTC